MTLVNLVQQIPDSASLANKGVANQISVEVAGIRPSGALTRQYFLTIHEDEGAIKVVEAGTRNLLPTACPERHVNRNGSFCLGLDVGKNVHDLETANSWWKCLLDYLVCQDFADSQRRWPPDMWLSHGTAAEAHVVAEKQAEKIGLKPAYRQAIEHNEGWLAGALPRVQKSAFRLCNGRMRCPEQCADKWGRPIFRRDCKKNEGIARLITLENIRRKRSDEFVAQFKNDGFVCCGTMDDCPFRV